MTPNGKVLTQNDIIHVLTDELSKPNVKYSPSNDKM